MFMKEVLNRLNPEAIKKFSGVIIIGVMRFLKKYPGVKFKGTTSHRGKTNVWN